MPAVIKRYIMAILEERIMTLPEGHPERVVCQAALSAMDDG